MEITITKDKLIENLKTYFGNEYANSLAQTTMDEEEIQANIVINRKAIEADANRVANAVFNSSVDEVTGAPVVEEPVVVEPVVDTPVVEEPVISIPSEDKP